jgi:hypothetical protein
MCYSKMCKDVSNQIDKLLIVDESDLLDNNLAVIDISVEDIQNLKFSEFLDFIYDATYAFMFYESTCVYYQGVGIGFSDYNVCRRCFNIFRRDAEVKDSHFFHQYIRTMDETDLEIFLCSRTTWCDRCEKPLFRLQDSRDCCHVTDFDDCEFPVL